MRIIHTADIHARRDRMNEVLASLGTLEKAANGSDLVIIAGDIWDSAPSATGPSRFPELLDSVQEIAEHAPVAMIYGTPSHDLDGSLDVFEMLSTRHGVTILRPGVPYGLYDHMLIDLRHEEPLKGKAVDALILGIPEPSKEFVIANVEGISKEGADEEIREGMRRFLIGLAALRKQYTHLPAVVAYHGQIAGATLQNGQEIPAGAGLAIGRDDLAMIGADYYALGDIHLPQQIGQLPAYYPGSVYPVDWGETHQCGFNVVTIGGGQSQDAPPGELDLFSNEAGSSGNTPAVERIDYPHPRNQKITAKAIQDNFGIDVGDHDQVEKGNRVWLEISCTADQAQRIDVGLFEGRLKLQGALDGSRVTLKIAASETVRAADIAEHQTLRGKLGVYAEQTTNTEVPALAYDYADTLDAEHRENVGAGAYIRIDRLVLRGAIGIWRGLRQDSIEIDFREYSPGLIALIGANGKGKTTLIENLHPWPQLLTRDGKLADHFRLRDSRRELYFTDAKSGAGYKSVILVDSQSGSGEYHLYRDNAGEWEPLTNGRKEPYVTAVEEIFGSLQLFLKSAFISQKPSKASPDIQDATKGERKALFIELAGLEHLHEYSQTAKGRADEIERDSLSIRGKIEAKQDQVRALPELRKRETELKAEVLEAEKRLEELEAKGKGLQAEHEAAREAEEQQRRIRENIDELNERIRKLNEDITRKQDEKEKAEGAAATDVQLLKAEIAEIEMKQGFYNTLLKERAVFDDEQARVYREYRGKVKQAEQDRRELEASRQAVKDNVMAIEHEIQSLTRDIGTLADRLDRDTDDGNCPVCGQSWPAHKRQEHEAELAKIRTEHDEKRARLFELEGEADDLDKALSTANEAVEAHRMPGEPVTPEFPKSDRLKDLEEQLGWVNIDVKRQELSRAETAAQTLSEIQSSIDTLTSDRGDAHAKLMTLEEQVRPGTREQLNEAEEKLATARREYSDAKYNVGSLQSTVEHVRGEIVAAEEVEAEIAAEQARVNEMMESSTAWRWLEMACGRNGIQALELDALAPSIAGVANELLESAYGTRFMIEFRTTRMGGSGSTQKQIEDFLVMIHDAETGMEQELKTLSGGEAVWIKKAIYDAFGIIRSRNTGTTFLTAFQDEADGALDPEAKLQYFRMLEAAHTRSGRAHTVVITHSQEIQQMIQQRIVMGELADKSKEVAA